MEKEDLGWISSSSAQNAFENLGICLGFGLTDEDQTIFRHRAQFSQTVVCSPRSSV